MEPSFFQGRPYNRTYPIGANQRWQWRARFRCPSRPHDGWYGNTLTTRLVLDVTLSAEAYCFSVYLATVSRSRDNSRWKFDQRPPTNIHRNSPWFDAASVVVLRSLSPSAVNASWLERGVGDRCLSDTATGIFISSDTTPGVFPSTGTTWRIAFCVSATRQTRDTKGNFPRGIHLPPGRRSP